MFLASEALDFLAWGNANLVANRVCAVRARKVLDDANAGLRRGADLQGLSYQRESLQVMFETSEQAQHIGSSGDVYTSPHRHIVRARIAQMPVPPLTAAIIADAYEIGDTEQVQLDARELNRWTLPLDDFAARLGTAHDWKAEIVVIYIGALRSALLDRHTPTPWDDL
jgi:hypothetical protein